MIQKLTFLLLAIAIIGVVKGNKNSNNNKIIVKLTARDGGLSSVSDTQNDDFGMYTDEDSNWPNEGDEANDNKYEIGSAPVYVSKQPKYEKKPNNNPYEAAPLSNQLAQVIPAVNAESLTLDQKYPQNSAHETYPYGSSPYMSSRVEVLLDLIFALQVEQWSPRISSSQFQFVFSPSRNDTIPTDNAAFVIESGSGGYSTYSKNGDASSRKIVYGGKKSNSNNNGYVLLYSVPYKNYVPPGEPGVENSYCEGCLRTKTLYTIGATQRFLVRMKSACKTFNAEQHPFLASQVTKPWDDPRLVNCIAPSITDDNSGIHFYITVTNAAVWAVYARLPTNTTALQFVVKRRIGLRPRYDSLVDAAIEIDNRQGVANYYLNGYLVWTINSIGFLPPYDGVNNIDIGQGTPSLAQVRSAYIVFGTEKCLDESDPNNLLNPTRLVAILGSDSTYYSQNATFVDRESLRGSSYWGQGAILTMIKLTIARGESVAQPQLAPLSGVYEPQPSKYDPPSANQYNNAQKFTATGNVDEWAE